MNMKIVLIVVLILSISFLVMIGCAQKVATSPTPAPASPAPSAERVGKQLFLEKGCIGCHRINGEGSDIGPSVVGISGRTVELTTGQKLIRTHEYLHESIIEPDAKVVKGYQLGIMPKTSLTADQLHELAEFIKSLK